MDFIFEVLPNTRAALKKIIESYTLEDLNKIPEGFNNNIIWNIGHIVVTEQLLIYKLSGLQPMVSDDIINKYRKDSKPNGNASQTEVNEIKDLLFATIEKTKNDYANNAFKGYKEYTVSTTGNTLKNVDEALSFVLFHEGIHMGYILALKRAIKN
ncbi:DinB family protein [Postechiella marina]|uniref:DinB family protein n=1 Tax=Postechiella marina TaxID=943941 RepID=A0ABP8C478_9FLAO